MASTKRSREPRISLGKIRPTEAEVARLLQEAAQQYEEYEKYVRLANLADLSDDTEVSQLRYEWDNPIGLVITKGQGARLV